MAWQPKTERRTPLNDAQKELMMTVLIRHPEAFLAVRTQLQAGHFGQYDQRYAVLWAAVCDYYVQHRELPGEQYLLAETQRRLDDDPGLLVDEEIEQLDAFMQRSFLLDASELKPRYAISKAKQFLEESLQARLAGAVSSEEMPVSLGKLLGAAAEEASQIQGLDSRNDPAFPADGWQPKGVRKVSTGVVFLDRYLRGGDAPGEVNVLLGPYGSCKTMLTVQLGVQKALGAYQLWLEGGRKGPIPVTYHFSAEADLEELRLRALCHAAQVHVDSIDEKEKWASLSTQGSLKDYEKKLFAKALRRGVAMPGERERVDVYQRILNRCWLPVDMTGSGENHHGRGGGGIDEIAAIILRDQQTRENPGVRVVLIDYAQAVAERYVQQHQGGDHHEMRFVVGKMPMHAKNQIALPYQTPVWIVGQLSGEANSRSVATVSHHSESAEAKNFAENAAFAFCIGMPDVHNRCLLACTKVRRAARQAPTVIQIDGAMHTVRDAEEYSLDTATRRIVRTAELRGVLDDSPTKRSKSSTAMGAQTVLLREAL